ncbi:MAG TPA: NADPH-dependent F420 reductase [bacterium]|nr:NADPH-dependent F420 reductase [bacterium]
MAIAVIGGTGRQGLGLALRWAAAGIPIIIGSRSLDRAEAAAREVRAMVGKVAAVQAQENVDAARAAEIVVITVPAAAHAETVAAIAPAVAGKIIVDVTVPLEKNPSYAVQLPEGSAAEAAQRALGPEARVIGAFHTVPASLLADLGRPVDCDILVCGDDAQAKARVMELATALGSRGVDVGALRQTHTLERLTALLIGTGRKAHRHELGVRITGL